MWYAIIKSVTIKRKVYWPCMTGYYKETKITMVNILGPKSLFVCSIKSFLFFDFLENSVFCFGAVTGTVEICYYYKTICVCCVQNCVYFVTKLSDYRNYH